MGSIRKIEWCDCGLFVTKGHLKRHKKSIVHKRIMEGIKNEKKGNVSFQNLIKNKIFTYSITSLKRI